MKINKTFIIAIVLFFSAVLIVGIAYVWIFSIRNDISGQSEISQKEQEQRECLDDDEIVNYKIEKKKDEVSTADIIISDKKSGQKKYHFQIELPIPDHYHPLELHKCGVYAVRSFAYDYKKKQALSEYKAEFWQYKYNGIGRPLIFLSGPISGSGFGSDFRVSPDEKYLVLEKSYLGKDDYSLVIKDLKTKEDVFTLLSKSLQERNPSFVGVFDMLEWSKDGRYFWGSVSDGAYVNGYFRIDTSNWEVDIYEAPDGAMGGSKLNINTGYLPIQPGQIWTGDVDFDEINRERLLKEGKKSELYLYNLFTKEKIFITSNADDPLWWFKPDWLSDAELQYELLTGEKKIYKLQEM